MVFLWFSYGLPEGKESAYLSASRDEALVLRPGKFQQANKREPWELPGEWRREPTGVVFSWILGNFREF